APEAVPAIGYRTYVIVLKDSAKADQITSLLQRYNLTITKTVPGLHMLRVERPEDDAKSAPTASATAPAEGREGLARLLNPKIIQDSRGGPIVDSAFVESRLSPKSVPKAKSTSIVDGGVKYRWHWKDGLGGAPESTPAVAPVKPTDEPQDGNWGLKAM